jgi:hypothetical protein
LEGRGTIWIKSLLDNGNGTNASPDLWTNDANSYKCELLLVNTNLLKSGVKSMLSSIYEGVITEAFADRSNHAYPVVDMKALWEQNDKGDAYE